MGWYVSLELIAVVEGVVGRELSSRLFESWSKRVWWFRVP